MKQPYIWDNYSDQPYPLKDKAYKKIKRRENLTSILKTIIISLFVFPISLIMMPFVKNKKIDTSSFFCLGVDYQREPSETLKLVKELGVKHILIRLKLWEIDTLDNLKEFILNFQDEKITLKIMQDRENVESLELFRNNLELIFSKLGNKVDIYEIGTTINRAKWGFFSVDEYNAFFKTAYDLKEQKHPELKLIGSGVIDFEYHFTAHTLFNFFKYKYDGISALLYVDRRGAPENMQLGFNASDKIALLSTMVWLSPKTKHELYLTEINWPISNTAPYAPTSEKECIDLESYANYMLRYYLLALASQQVDALSWHQLIAPGYGLVDNRDSIKKYPAFKTYKTMIKNLKNAQFLRLDINRQHYIFQCLVDEELLQIHWSLKPTTIHKENNFDVYSKDGEKIEDQTLQIGPSPIYVYIKTKTRT
ncbi:glycosyl hydrolase [Sulfurimonas lithotrophica]|uniref:Glycosyl hydrolase n=1 Tax=Sulfurimonas lithotrophica TaxID=2590022 RepID=A0A5P8NZ01_9BACT|nr:glycosyl hydrolase [Sulfurimonas lithotrophica]QFR48646.1 glycosyl hydrolase [Sulfurimonas lithotrophica]